MEFFINDILRKQVNIKELTFSSIREIHFRGLENG